jgi:hypothetical protein
MTRRVPLLALAALAVGWAASRPGRSQLSRLSASAGTVVGGRGDRLPRGVETYPSPLVDRRTGADGVTPAGQQGPAETPAEIVQEFYEEHPAR